MLQEVPFEDEFLENFFFFFEISPRVLSVIPQVVHSGITLFEDSCY